MFYLPSDVSNEAAKQGLRLSADTVRLAIKKGQLKAMVTPGGVKVVAQADLDVFLAARKAKVVSRMKKAA